jgi:hypothetical protein
MKRSEILKNRQTWINRLLDPESKKGIHKLKDGDSFCCLGHGCDVLLGDSGIWGLKDTFILDDHEYEHLPPNTFCDMVGLWDYNGGNFAANNLDGYSFTNLVDVNDLTDNSPQEIGEYLESVIEGGHNTPFKPLNTYEE